MRGAARNAWLAGAALMAMGCRQGPTEFRAHLADPRPYPIAGGDRPAQLVIVERLPTARTGWPMFVYGVRRLLGLERPDTLSGVRVIIPPVVRSDSLVAGLDVLFRPFTYDAAARQLRRSPTPPWVHEMAMDLMVPVFSPAGRYLAYLARTPEGAIESVVRDWRDGLVLLRGPRGPPPADRLWQPASAVWIDSSQFIAAYNLWIPQDVVRVTVRGRIGDPVMRVDSTSILDSVTAVLAEEHRAAEFAAQRAEEEQAAATNALEARLDAGVHDVRRLPVAAFPDVPTPFARGLDSLGCGVPQSYFDAKPHNVIHGGLGAAGQQDWAVLCSRGGRSSILVHWGGPRQCPSELMGGRDRDYLIALDSTRVGFASWIVLTDRYHEYDGQGRDGAGVELAHQAIEHHTMDKAPNVLFCREGEWVTFAGID